MAKSVRSKIIGLFRGHQLEMLTALAEMTDAQLFRGHSTGIYTVIVPHGGGAPTVLCDDYDQQTGDSLIKRAMKYGQGVRTYRGLRLAREEAAAERAEQLAALMAAKRNPEQAAKLLYDEMVKLGLPVIRAEGHGMGLGEAGPPHVKVWFRHRDGRQSVVAILLTQPGDHIDALALAIRDRLEDPAYA